METIFSFSRIFQRDEKAVGRGQEEQRGYNNERNSEHEKLLFRIKTQNKQ